MRKKWHQYVAARPYITEIEYLVGYDTTDVFDQYHGVSQEQQFAAVFHFLVAIPIDDCIELMYLDDHRDLVAWFLGSLRDTVQRCDTESDIVFKPFPSSEPQSEYRQMLIAEANRCLAWNVEICKYSVGVIDDAHRPIFKDSLIQMFDVVESEANTIMDMQKSKEIGVWLTPENSMPFRMFAIGSIAFCANLCNKNDHIVYEAIKPYIDLSAILMVLTNDLFSTWKETVAMPNNPSNMILKELHNGMTFNNAFRKFCHERNLAIRECEKTYESNQNPDERILMWKYAYYLRTCEHFHLDGHRYGFGAFYP